MGVSAAGGDGESASDDCPVAGHKFLNGEVSNAASECLNESDDHPLAQCLVDDDEAGFLASDCDEQLIISLSFNQVYTDGGGYYSVKVWWDSGGNMVGLW